MSRQMLIFLGLLVLVFGSGIALGLFIGSAPAASNASQKSAGSSSSGFFSSAEAQDREQGNMLLSDRIRELEKELAERKESDGAKARFDFFKQHHGQIHMEAFDRNSLKVTPEMAVILGLTDEEQKVVTARLQEVQNEMNQLVEADKSPVNQNGNSLSYEISADPRGKELKDNLASDLAGDIGADRADVLVNYGDFSVYSSFNDFSQSKKDIGLTWEQKNGHTQYTETTTFYRSDGTPQGSTSTSPDFVPPDFQKYLPNGTPTAMPPTVTQ